jgi:tetratricopeptide (TPR) repeat protein
VHRDFKPDNVLVQVQDGSARRVVVTDFGIARATSMCEADVPIGEGSRGDVRLTASGLTVGTPAYMAPEQLAAESVDLRADVFAFSVSLWEGLFGARPFAGRTVDEIRHSMRDRPKAPRGGVPRRLVRVLQRGLAIDPGDRWPDLVTLAGELASVRTRARRRLVAAGGAGLVGLGLAGALLFTGGRAEDPCERATQQLAVAYPRSAALFSLARDPNTRALVMHDLDDKVGKWLATQAATCHADMTPAQSPTVTACLDARRLEITSVVDDVIIDGPAHARSLSGVVERPDACANPPQSALFAKVPADRALRRRVTALRYQGFDSEMHRDSGDFAGALALAKQMVADAKGVWGPVEAESLYALGTTQEYSDPKAAIETLRRAAALGEATHHDYIAANAWIQLVLTTTVDEGHPQRALEYVAYAEAALDRLGHPARMETMLQYAKGGALVDADRTQEAEVALRRAVDLAEREDPDDIPQTIQGLGYLYEQEGRYGDAVEAYRRALAHLPASGPGVVQSQVVFRERLASNLSNEGKPEEAEAYARDAAARADRALGERNTDRYSAHVILAQILKEVGKREEAIAEAALGVDGIRQVSGERSEPYAEALTLEGEVLGDAGRPAEAEPLLSHACEIIAYNNEASSKQAECWLRWIDVLQQLGRAREALALSERAMPLLEKVYGDSHPEVGYAYALRAHLYGDLHRHPQAVADYERSLALFQRQSKLEPGYLGEAHAGLGEELWASDRSRARRELDAARESYAHASHGWERQRAELENFVAGHR